jgi:acyl-CoA thioesterase-1
MAQDFAWNDGERVMFLGDSLTEDPQGYARLVPPLVTARYPELAIDYLPRGVGGNRVGDLLERLDRDVLGAGQLPTWISISIGINDVWHGATGTPLGRFRDLYAAVLTRVKDTGARLVCFTTTVIGEELDNEQNAALVGYNDAIRELAFGQGAEVVDMHAAFIDAITRAQARDPQFRFTTDGVHMNPIGSNLMTITLLKALHYGF